MKVLWIYLRYTMDGSNQIRCPQKLQKVFAMKSTRMKLLYIFSPTLLLLLLVFSFPAGAVDQVATISIPEDVLSRIIKDGLPITIEAQSQYVQGEVIFESLENLQVMEKSLLLQGVASGRNFTVVTTIAGREITMKLGNVQLPVSCELFLRFDSSKKTLFVTPRFPKPKSLYSTDPADALLLLLSSLDEDEYPVELGAIRPIIAEVGSSSIPIELEPVDIQTQKGLLLIKMKPTVSKKLRMP